MPVRSLINIFQEGNEKTGTLEISSAKSALENEQVLAPVAEKYITVMLPFRIIFGEEPRLSPIL